MAKISPEISKRIDNWAARELFPEQARNGELKRLSQPHISTEPDPIPGKQRYFIRKIRKGDKQKLRIVYGLRDSFDPNDPETMPSEVKIIKP